jgi:hypothetical protein
MVLAEERPGARSQSSGAFMLTPPSRASAIATWIVLSFVMCIAFSEVPRHWLTLFVFIISPPAMMLALCRNRQLMLIGALRRGSTRL